MDATSLAILALVIGIIVVANLGEGSPSWRIAAYALTVGLGLAVAGLGLLYLLAGWAQQVAPGMVAPLLSDLPGQGLARLGYALLAGGVASCVVLLPPVRRAVARVIPIRPASVVNAVALSLLVILLAQSVGLGGLGPQGFVALTGRLTVLQVVFSEIPLVLIALAGVGLIIRRRPAQAWDRLGLLRLTWRQLGSSLAGVAGLLALQVIINAAAAALAPQAIEELRRATERFYAGLGTPLAAVVVSLTSGIAEEILFRGAAQPRFGLILTSFTFGVVHSQYGVAFALISVGVVGLVLGIYRQRINTTASVVIHVLYNLTLFLLAAL